MGMLWKITTIVLVITLLVILGVFYVDSTGKLKVQTEILEDYIPDRGLYELPSSDPTILVTHRNAITRLKEKIVEMSKGYRNGCFAEYKELPDLRDTRFRFEYDDEVKKLALIISRNNRQVSYEEIDDIDLCFVTENNAANRRSVPINNIEFYSKEDKNKIFIPALISLTGFEDYLDEVIEGFIVDFTNVLYKNYKGEICFVPTKVDEDTIQKLDCFREEEDIDNDGDGIFESFALPWCADGNKKDCQDNCPSKFNSDQKDSDGDGIGDKCDECLDEKANEVSYEDRTLVDGEEVLEPKTRFWRNANGCVDKDKDWIPDKRDDCLETDESEIVNNDGCAENQIDSDNDGVFGNKDLCPETEYGLEVDPDGCDKYHTLGDERPEIEDNSDLREFEP
jgi:hypothetical protein